MNWTPQGARPATNGQSEGVTDREIVGAVNAVAPHPTDANILYKASVNGGVWRTRNALDTQPDWVSLMPVAESLSIGALCLDRTDPASQTLVAGTGRFSSMRRVGGALLGVMRSTDSATWTVLDNGGLFRALHIRAIHAAGDVMVLAGNAGRQSNADGVYRSGDEGRTFAHLSSSALLPGRSLALAASPLDANLIYVHAGRAIFSSNDGGATWKRISSSVMESLLSNPTNVRIAAGPGDTVFVAIALSGRLAALFNSGDRGESWTMLDLPTTFEGGGSAFGLHPGGQAEIHFSLAADLEDANIVYIGGDRQPAFNERPPPGQILRQFPNSIGAQTYSGRLFRVDAGQPSGLQAQPITHQNTASNSAPHADSRTMAIASNGDLIEGDDGGVYRRVDPRSDTGDWHSMIGSLQTTEFHSAAWDPASQVTMGGAQDNGTLRQASAGGARWPTVMGGDGGVVAIAPRSASGGSVRYSSFQNLGAARREFFNANGTFQGSQRLQLRVVGTTTTLSPQFYSPIQVNRADPLRLVICGRNAVWESFDRGDTLRLVSPHGIEANFAASVAYGGTNDADVLCIGAGRDVFIRNGAPPAQLVRTTGFSTNEPVTSVTLDPDSPATVYATLSNSVHRTTDSGQTWTDVTGNLLAAGGRTLRSIIWCGNIGNGQLIVGSNFGIYMAEAPDFTTWTRLGSGLPAAPVMQLQYDDASQMLLAATLGRGAWTMTLEQELIALNDDDAGSTARAG